MMISPQAQTYMDQIEIHGTGSRTGPLDAFFWWNLRSYHADGDTLFAVLPNSDERLTNPADVITVDGTTYTPGKTFKLANLVLQGGGTLGLAHAGFITGLELAGVRFPGIAGTAAGSIIAMGMIAIRGRDITKSTKDDLIKLVGSVPMDEFLDGPRPIRRMIKQALLGRSLLKPQYWSGVISSLKRILWRRGLNHGLSFETWLQGLLADQYGLGTLEDLDSILEEIAGQLNQAAQGLNGSNPFGGESNSNIEPEDLLKIFATAMPVGVKFEFPRDMRYLGDLYSTSSPAILVRMSMSIPLFFEPVVRKIEKRNWKGPGGDNFVENYLADVTPKKLTEDYKFLEELAFLDGGLFSNLPTDAFHKTMKDLPTISVPLVSDTGARITRKRSLKKLGEDVLAVASALRLQRDRDAIIRRRKDEETWIVKQGPSVDESAFRQAFPVQILKVDTGNANWLNFVMSDDEKAQLFEAGMKRAHDFIFNWEAEQ